MLATQQQVPAFQDSRVPFRFSGPTKKGAPLPGPRDLFLYLLFIYHKYIHIYKVCMLIYTYCKCAAGSRTPFSRCATRFESNTQKKTTAIDLCYHLSYALMSLVPSDLYVSSLPCRPIADLGMTCYCRAAVAWAGRPGS